MVYVCENNLYGVTTPTSEVCNLHNMADAPLATMCRG
ncbi:MAG: hypothetical protein IPG20_06860 [Gammaproteobacteria bacterium]|nr:hypothetical protein [Gammaproteobacteria bacterium]